MKNYKRIIAMVCTMLVLLTASGFVMTGCGKKNNNTQNQAPVTQIVKEKFETPYCMLEYDKTFKDDMVIKASEKADTYKVSFKAKNGEKQIALFDVQFGKGTGNYIGKINKDGKKTDVYLTFHDIPTENFTEEEMDRIYAMQENINLVSDSITNDANFEE